MDWEQRAKAAYEADGDGCGWDSDGGGAGEGLAGGAACSPEERGFISSHPGVPVVERLGDLWRLSQLQAAIKNGGGGDKESRK